jgi:hypothetical protein
MILLILIGWLACGFAAAGIEYAYMQASYPKLADEARREDAGYAVMMGLGGPAGLIVAYLFSGFAEHGWKFPGTK